MEAFVMKPMVKKVYELYRDHQIDDKGLTNAINKHWVTTAEAEQIREAVKKAEAEKTE